MAGIDLLSRFLVAGVALLGYLPLAPWLERLPMMAVPVTLVWWLGADRLWQPLSSRLATPLAMLLFIIYTSRVSMSQLVEPAVNLLALFLALRLVTQQNTRHARQTVALAIFCLAASSLFSLDASFLFCLLAQLTTAAVTLVVLTVADSTSHTSTPLLPLRPLAAVSLVIPLATVPLALLFFLILPRTQIPLWNALAGGGERAVTGISDRVAPGTSPAVSDSRVVAFRAAMPPLDPARLYWRGIVLNRFDGTAWLRTQPPAETPVVQGTTGVFQEIYLEGSRAAVLPTLNVPRALSGIRAHNTPDLVYRPVAAGGKQRYTVVSAQSETILVPRGIDRDFYLQLPPILPPLIAAAGSRIRRETADAEDSIRRTESFFKAQRIRYSTSDLPTGPDALDRFLFSQRRGHCEFFASSYALMLRQAGVPCRLVGGYLGGTYNALGGYFVVTEDRAHVWVEAYITGRGWISIDPSRWAVNFDQARAAHQPDLVRRLALLLDTGSYYWNVTVISYDLERQMGAAGRLAALPRSINLPDLRRWGPFFVLTTAMILLLLRLVRHMRTSREERLVRNFLRRIKRIYGIVPEQYTGLHALAADTGDPAAIELVNRYGAFLFRDRRLTRSEASELQRLCRRIHREKGVAPTQ